jgi:hypothetical protein
MPPEEAQTRGRLRRTASFLTRLAIATLLLWAAAVLFITLTVDLPMGPPGTPGLGVWVGPVHVHSEASHDSRGTLGEIWAAAAEQGLDFVLVADHNALQSAAVEHRGVLLALAEEVSTHPGHWLLLGGGEDWRDNTHPDRLDVAHAAPLARAGGTTGLLRPGGPLLFLAHPTGPNTWDDPDFTDYDGMEIWNADLEWRWGDGILDWIHVLATLPVRPVEAMVHLVDRPDPALRWFDRESQNRSLAALCSVDTHQQIDLTDSWKLDFPTYRQMFSLARMHVLVGRPRSRDPEADVLALYDALGAGRAYCSFDVLADGSGLGFEVTSSGSDVPMGSRAVWSPDARMTLNLPPAGDWARVELFRNGEMVAEGHGRTLQFDLTRPGVYRIEVLLPTPGLRGGWKPWIMTNPVYLDPEPTDP